MTTRDRLVLIAVLAVALVVGGWLLVISPKRDQAASLGNQVSAAQSQLASAQAQLGPAEAARNGFANTYIEMVRLGEAVPADDQVGSLIYQLQHAASTTGVDFRTLTLSSSGSSAPTPTNTTTPGNTSSGSGAPAPAATSTPPPGVSVGAAGFDTEQFTFSFEGNFFHLSDFFNRLQRFVDESGQRVSISGRLMTVNSISFAAGASGFPQILATVNATTYLEPVSQGVLAGATPGGPAGSPSTQSTSASSSSSTPASAAVVSPLR